VEYLRGHKIPATPSQRPQVGEEPDAGVAVPDHDPAAAGQDDVDEAPGTDPVPVPSGPERPQPVAQG
jgi:hypothetical protein